MTGGKITPARLLELKQSGEKITSLTAYDACMAGILDAAGIDIVLVGDSLGMVLHGEKNTLGVSMEDMIYHGRSAGRACRRALVVVDMPYRSYETASMAYDNARRLMDAGGAEAVKLEGGATQAGIVAELVRRGIPVCGHIGLQPQSIKKYGGYKVQGRSGKQADSIRADARALEAAGAAVLVLECIPAALARRISGETSIPTIGIGAGAHCDGQVLVVYDALGLSERTPRMARNFLAGAGDVRAAVKAYIRAVKDGAFPGEEHSFE